MSAGFIHFFQASAGAGAARMQAELLRQGLGLRLYTSADALCDAVSADEFSRERRVVILASALAPSCQAALALRRIDSGVNVVALLPSIDDESVLRAMRSGIDACWPEDVPAGLLVSGVLRLMGQDTAVPRTARAFADDRAWRFASRGWVVQAPDGANVTLTTAERALMAALCKSPGRRLSHVELMRAIESELDMEARGQPSSGRGEYAWPDARRLSVLVSRLRHKFTAAGVEMPIRSLRRVGYEICVEFADEADAGAVDAFSQAAPGAVGRSTPVSRTDSQAVAVAPETVCSAMDP